MRHRWEIFSKETWQRRDERAYIDLTESNHRENAPLNRSHPFLKANDNL